MIRTCANILFGLALMAVSVPVSANETGSSRVMLSVQEQKNWQAIGRLNVTGIGYCTATAIGPDLILTAAHCVVDKRTGNSVRPDRVHFLAGFRAGTFAAHGQGREIVLMQGYNRSMRTVDRDIAFIRLAAPLPATITPISTGRGVQPELSLHTLSYGLDRAQIPSIERDCRLQSRIGAVIYTSCDGVPGVSGAPVIQMVDGKPVVVAVASAVMARQKAPMLHGTVLAVDAAEHRLEILFRQFEGTDVSMPDPVRDGS
ncbi:serine protease [Meridianimarinicoccus sp. MJW13]|uniref:trypsin-like serine peptidase n=1 Tax=Meridianimarinicoccus sp. MJW13 TaxID=2720031 RepID=UPI001865D9D3|nr:trypsin-like serine protease [Fluviibacterium sp. MJW13]